MGDPGGVRPAVLWGPDHQSLGQVALETVSPSLAAALSPGRYPRGYPHLDPNEDGVLVFTDGVASVLAVADGHSGFDAARAALQVVLAQAGALLSGTPQEALAGCFAAATEAVGAAVAGLEGERAASGTALTVAIVEPTRMTVAGLGDCRAVVVRGKRARKVGSPGPFLRSPAEHTAVAVHRVGLRPGDRVLVATDGLFEFLGRDWERLLAGLASEGDAGAVARRAVEAAFRGGAGDNIAVAAATVGSRARAGVRRRKVALGAIALTLLIGAWGVLGAMKVSSARRDAGRAESAAREAADLVGSGDLEGARAALVRVLDSLDSARASLRAPLVSPLRLVPFAGTELRASIAGVDAARDTSLAALDLLEFLLADRAPLYAAGRLDPVGLGALRTVLHEAVALVADAGGTIAAAPHPRLGFVARRLAEAGRVTSILHDTLSGAVPMVDRLTEAAEGGRPYRLLVLLENGAERRATGGLVGFVTLLEVDEEGVRLVDPGSVGRLQTRDATGHLVAVEAPADYLRRYGEFQANTTLWSNVNMSPDFPTVAAVARRLYQVATGVEADAVARIDLVGLGYLLDAFPGVTIEAREVDGTTLATDFLIDSYRRFPDNNPGAQNAYLASAVQEVLGQLIGGAQGDRSGVLSAVRRAVGERRLSLVTSDAAVNTVLAGAGADGAVLAGGPGDLMVTTQNLAFNKIDLYTRTGMSIDLTADGCQVVGEIAVTVTNATPSGMDFLPRQVLGNNGRWMISVYVPRDALVLGLEVDGLPMADPFLEEFGRMVVSVIVDADLGTSTTVTVRWQEQLIEPGYTLTLQPQPLVVPGTLAVNGDPPMPFLETQRFEFADICAG